MTFTVLAAHTVKRLAKTVTYTGGDWIVRDFDHVGLFDVVEYGDHSDDAPSSLEELSQALTVMEAHDHACLIRGRLRDGVPREGIRRLSVDDDHSDADVFFGSTAPMDGLDGRATFEDQPLHWAMIDVDRMAADPEWTEAQRIAAMIAKLPPAFRGADFHLQWSSKAGLDGWKTISAHLFFWLAEPITSAHLKARAKDEGWSGIDHALFQTVQIHYTAAPVFVGAVDPLKGQRSQLIRLNRREVTLPAWTPKAEPIATCAVRPFDMTNPLTATRIRSWSAAVVAKRCEAIVTAPDGEQNRTIYSTAAMLGSMVAGNLIDEGGAVAALEQAASQGGHPADRARSTIRQGLRRGKHQPVYGPPE